MSRLGRQIEIDTAHGGSELTRIDYLDGWRGLAILLVLQAHFFGAVGLDSGRLGVDLFFVLSGLLMARILFVKRVPLGTFYKRRISRILPLFVLYVLVWYGFGFLSAKAEASNLPSTLFFLRTYFPADQDIWFTDIPIGHLWSLHVEEHCYLFLGLLAALPFLRGREGRFLVPAGMLSIAVHVLYGQRPDLAPVDIGVRTEAVAGHLLLAAGYYRIRARFERRVRPWMPPLALALGIACYSDRLPEFASFLVSPFLLAFAVNHLDGTYPGLQRALSYEPLRLVGVWSYSIYVWQQPFFHYGMKSGPPFPGAGPLLFLASVGAGILSFKLFENPLRTWMNRRW